MQTVHPITSHAQLAMLEPTMRAGIQELLDAVDTQHRRTVDLVWEELGQHIDQQPHAVLLGVFNGQFELVGWVAGKVYYDGPKRTGCITWAWAAAGCRLSKQVLAALEAWFAESGCQAAALTRPLNQPAFTRLMRRYGYEPVATLYEKRLAA